MEPLLQHNELNDSELLEIWCTPPQSPSGEERSSCFLEEDQTFPNKTPKTRMFQGDESREVQVKLRGSASISRVLSTRHSGQVVPTLSAAPGVCCVTGNQLSVFFSLPLSSSSSDFRDLFTVNSDFREKEPVHGVRKHSSPVTSCSPSGCNIPRCSVLLCCLAKNKSYLDKK